MVLVVTLIKLAFVMLLIGWIPAVIARSKGRDNFLGWWIYGGALFLIALVHAIVIRHEGGVVEGKSTYEMSRRCDGCRAAVPSSLWLKRIEGAGYLCAKCRGETA